MTDTITYELPLNERMRVLLRLQFPARQFDPFAGGTSVWDSRAAINALLDAIVLVDRADLRGELIKELERQAAVLAPLERVPGVDVTRLQRTLDEFDLATDHLKVQAGPLAPNLRTDQFLMEIQNRIGLPAGICDFDLPVFHAWLEGTADLRQRDLHRWAEELVPVWRAAELMLRVIREAAVPVVSLAEKGSFQVQFTPEQSCQVVRVVLPSAVSYYPTMSGDRHRVTIRFMSLQSEGGAVQVQEDVPFHLICCTL